MNKFQKRKNKIEPYKLFLNKNQMDKIIYNDENYKNFIKLINAGKEIANDVVNRIKLESMC